MADDEVTRNAGQGSEDEPPFPALPPRSELPPPPEIEFHRPDLKRSPGVPQWTRQAEPTPAPSERADTTLKLGSGLAAGTSFVASVVAGFWIGQEIDHRWNHSGFPWGTLIVTLLGVAAGFLNLFRVLSATDRRPK